MDCRVAGAKPVAVSCMIAVILPLSAFSSVTPFRTNQAGAIGGAHDRAKAQRAGLPAIGSEVDRCHAAPIIPVLRSGWPVLSDPARPGIPFFSSGYRHYALIRAGQGVCRLLDRILLDVGHDHVGARLGDAEPMP